MPPWPSDGSSRSTIFIMASSWPPGQIAEDRRGALQSNLREEGNQTIEQREDCLRQPGGGGREHEVRHEREDGVENAAAQIQMNLGTTL